MSVQLNWADGDALRKAIDCLPSMIAYWDRDLKCRFANRAYERWFGVPGADLIGTRLPDLLGPRLFALNEPHVNAALRGEPQVFEREIPCPDGVVRHSLAHYLPDVRDGEVQGFVVEVTEVTALKQVQVALQAALADRERVTKLLHKKEAALREAQRLGQIGSWEWEAGPDIAIWSGELYRILGIDPDRLPPSLSEGRALYTPESYERLEKAIDKALRSGLPYVLELEYVRPDGVAGWLEARGEIVRDETGAVVGLRGTAQEASARHLLREAHAAARAPVRDEARAQAEALKNAEVADGFFSRVAHLAPGVLYVYDLDAQSCIFLNRSVLAALGYPPDDVDALDHDVIPALMHPADLPRFVRHTVLLRALSEGEVTDFSYRMRDRSGGWRWFRSRDSVFIRHADGGVRQVVGTAMDVTEQRELEDALRRNAEVHRVSFDLAPVGMVFLGNDERFLKVNRKFCEITGYSDEELRGMTVDDLVHPLDTPTDIAKRRSFQHGQTSKFENEKRYRRKGGGVVWVRATVQMVRDEAGRPLHSIGVVEDITDQKEAEVARQHSELLLSRLVEQAPIGMYVVDGDFRVQQVNAIAAPVFGSVDPLIGRDFDEVMRILWGEAVGARCADIFRHTLATGERYVSPSFVEQRFDLGTQQAFEWETQRVTLGTGRHSVVCYFNEVTQRLRAERALRESEERMRLAVQATSVGIWEWQVDSDRMHWNNEMFQIYGLEATDDGNVAYADWRAAVLPEDRAAQEAALREALYSEAPRRRVFRIARRHDGAVRFIESHEGVRLAASGKAEWLVGTHLDVTERKLIEQALKDADRRKDEFLATLAHELRNPLAPIRNSIEILKRAQGNPALVGQVCAIIDRQMTHMVRLVDDLLDIGRITSDKLELQFEGVELASVIEHAVETVQPHIASANHALVVDVPRAAIELRADRARLAQVFVNLLHNSAKYTPNGGRIELAARLTAGEVAVTVSDTGTGIPPEMLPKVFELFAQVDRTLERSTGGLGIGLALARRLVAMHGGTIEAASAGQGRGSTFTVRLPLQPARRGQPLPETAKESTGLPDRLDVLIVDDNRDGAETLMALLDFEGHRATVASDGPAALAAVVASPPDAILLDIGLPLMDGNEVCRRIRQLPLGGKIWIAALTGWGQHADRQATADAGFDAHLVKPIDPEELLQLLGRCASRRR